MNDYSQEFPVCLKLHVFANHLYFFIQLNHSFTISVCELWYINDQNGISNIIWFVDIFFRNYITTSSGLSQTKQGKFNSSSVLTLFSEQNIFIESMREILKQR